jgi:hypothetical protein
VRIELGHLKWCAPTNQAEMLSWILNTRKGI